MKKFFITTLVLCLVQLGYSQNIQYLNNALNIYGDNINSGDARYIGMGGAMGALGGNVNSVNQNPAGIGVNISSDLSVTLGVSNFNNEANFGNTFETDDSQFNFQQLGAVLVLPGANEDWKSFSLGINYVYEDLDDALIVGANDNVTTMDADGNVFRFNGLTDEYFGYRQKLSLNFASNYQDKIYLGAGVNFHYADFENFITYSDTDQNNASAVYDQVNTPYFERGSGFSFSLGAIGKVNQNLRLGAAYHSPVWYNFIEEEFVSPVELVNGANEIVGYEGELLFSDYDLTSSGGRAVGSAGLVVGKNLALNFDYTYHFNEGINLRPTGNFNELNTFVDNGGIRNSSEFRMGGELRFDELKLRAGYNFVESPYENVVPVDTQGNINGGEISDAYIGDINRFSAGIGYDFGSFYIDAAYQRSQHEFNYLFGNNEYVNSDELIAIDESYVAQVDRTNSLFLLTLGWQF